MNENQTGDDMVIQKIDFPDTKMTIVENMQLKPAIWANDLIVAVINLYHRARGRNR